MKAKKNLTLAISILFFFIFSNISLFAQLPLDGSHITIQPNKDIFDYILFVIQSLSLIFLGIYVYKTWQIALATQESSKISKRVLEEMKATREQEVEPYVVAYFDVEFEEINLPPTVYFTVINTGKTEAKNVKLEFTPSLPIIDNCNPPRNLNELIMVKDGIPAMPPQFKIRTSFGFFISLFEKCNSYKVKISYQGLYKKLESEYVLDLKIFNDLWGKTPKGMPQLISEAETLNKSILSINKRFDYFVNRIDEGLWIKNYHSDFPQKMVYEDWNNAVHSTLVKHKLLWSTLIGVDYHKLNDNLSFSNLKSTYSQIAIDIFHLASKAPFGITQNIKEKLINFSSLLLQIEAPMYVCTEKSLDKYGNEFLKLADSILEEIHISKSSQRRKRKRMTYKKFS
jgi:hypothetical protein